MRRPACPIEPTVPPRTFRSRSESESRAGDSPAADDEKFADSLPKDYKPSETFKPVKSDEAIDDFLKLIDDEVNKDT